MVKPTRSEATVISTQGIGWIGSPGIYTAEMADGWRLVTDRVKPTGSHLFLQLWHCGRASHSDFHNGELPVSASAVKLQGDQIHTPFGKKDYETPRALSVEQIKQLYLTTAEPPNSPSTLVFQGSRSTVPTAIFSISSSIHGLINATTVMVEASRTRLGFYLKCSPLLQKYGLQNGSASGFPPTVFSTTWAARTFVKLTFTSSNN